MAKKTAGKGSYDIVVIGAGNAAFSSALAAHQAGARVAVLEAATKEMRGGNTRFTGGLFRFTYHNVEEIERMLGDNDDTSTIEFDPYSAEDYLNDIDRVTRGKYDPELINILISESFPTVCWLADNGIPFSFYRLPNLKIPGTNKHKLQFGAGFEVKGRGSLLSDRWFEIAEKQGIKVFYETQAVELLQDAKGRVSGVRAHDRNGNVEFRAKAVILGSGGFQSNPEMRTAYMGPAWSMVKVRGTRFNTGLMTRAALGIGAQGVGQWAGAHATPLDNDAGDYGHLEATDETSRVSYPLGLMVNLDGQRFADEGEDFKLYTYAKTGAKILDQKYGVIFQIFDKKTTPLLEKRYGTGKPETADTLEALAEKISQRSGDMGFNKSQFLKSVAEFNTAVGETEFDPMIKDGKHTSGLAVDKTNWAQRIDQAPYVAYPITTGITFTFGGLKINGDAQVVDLLGRDIPGLYATGEVTGGFFYYNYPGGAGLMRGAVFGRRAGTNAAKYAAGSAKKPAAKSKQNKPRSAKGKPAKKKAVRGKR